MADITLNLQLNIPTDAEITDYKSVAENFDFAKFIRDNFEAIDSKLGDYIVNRLVALGASSLVAQGSVYLKNDNNLFGYKSDGSYSNLITLEQVVGTQNIGKVGDYDITLWLAALDAVSVRAPKLTIATELRPDKTALNTREVYHEGNISNHCMSSLSANETFSQGVRNKFTQLTVSTQHPLDSAQQGSGAYTVPRDGVYLVNMVCRPVSLVNAQTVLRFGLSKVSGGIETFSDISDVFASNAWGSGFYNTSFMYKAKKGDILTPFINPLNESITVQAGTKWNIYYLGNTPVTNLPI